MTKTQMLQTLIYVTVLFGLGFGVSHYVVKPPEQCEGFNDWLFASRSARTKIACFVDERDSNQYCMQFLGKVPEKTKGDTKTKKKPSKTTKKGKKNATK